MLVDVISMRMVQMTVMQEIDMVAMADCGMTAPLAVLVGMIVMDGAVTSHTGSFQAQWSLQA